MKVETQNNGISRRSFIKRSAVAAIAMAAPMMLTGLVKADDPSNFGSCSIKGACVAMVGGASCKVDCDGSELDGICARDTGGKLVIILCD